MLFDERGAGGKDGGKRKKQPADYRPESMRDDSGKNCNYSSDEEARNILMPLCLLDTGMIESDEHYPNTKWHTPKAMTNQIERSKADTARADHLARIITFDATVA